MQTTVSSCHHEKPVPLQILVSKPSEEQSTESSVGTKPGLPARSCAWHAGRRPGRTVRVPLQHTSVSFCHSHEETRTSTLKLVTRFWVKAGRSPGNSCCPLPPAGSGYIRQQVAAARLLSPRSPPQAGIQGSHQQGAASAASSEAAPSARHLSRSTSPEVC